MDFFKELLILGRQVGLKFALGTDAHQPHEIAYSQEDVETLNQLGIGESDLIVV